MFVILPNVGLGVSKQPFKAGSVVEGNGDICVKTETCDGGAPWTGRAVHAFWIDAVTSHRDPASGLWPSSEPSADGSGVDLRQPRLITQQAIGLFLIRLRRVNATALQQSGNALGQELRQLPDFTVFWRP